MRVIVSQIKNIAIIKIRIINGEQQFIKLIVEWNDLYRKIEKEKSKKDFIKMGPPFIQL